jgi:hypothetical protein
MDDFSESFGFCMEDILGECVSAGLFLTGYSLFHEKKVKPSG